MKSKGSVHRHQNLHQMESKPTIPTLPTEAENSSNDLLEQVRRCAYELYEERGKEDGHDIENWLRPELEVTQKSTKAAAA